MKKLFAGVLLGIAGLTACQEEEAVLLGSNNKINSFEFEQTKALADARIEEDSVFLTVPSETDLTKLVPKIKVPSKAIIAPTSGVAQDFSQPVAYTVTAENGNSRTYYVVVNLDNEVRIESLSVNRLHAGDTITIDGTNLQGATLSLMSDSTEMKISAISTDAKKATFVLPNDATMVPGQYAATVVMGSGETASKTTLGDIIVLPEVPTIDVLGSGPISEQQRLTVIGKNFSATKNRAFFVKDGISYFANIKQESPNQIVITPRTVKITGEYQVKIITAEEQEVTSEEKIQFFNTNVMIDSLSSEAFKYGDKLVMYGKNFVKEYNPSITLIDVVSNRSHTIIPTTVTSPTTAEVAITDGLPEGNYRVTISQWVNTTIYGDTISVSAPDRVVIENK